MRGGGRKICRCNPLKLSLLPHNEQYQLLQRHQLLRRYVGLHLVSTHSTPSPCTHPSHPHFLQPTPSTLTFSTPHVPVPLPFHTHHLHTHHLHTYHLHTYHLHTYHLHALTSTPTTSTLGPDGLCKHNFENNR